MHRTLTPAASVVAQLRQHAALLVTDVALTAQRQVAVYPMMATIGRFARQAFASELFIGRFDAGVIDAQTTRIAERAVKNMATTDGAIGWVGKHVRHHPAMTFFRDVSCGYLVMHAAIAFAELDDEDGERDREGGVAQDGQQSHGGADGCRWCSAASTIARC